MTLPVGLAMLAMKSKFCASVFSSVILADLHS